MTEYRIEGDTAYHIDTPIPVIEILEDARRNRSRIRIWYGKDGRCWNDEFDTIGTVGRSTGQYKIPLLIKNSRSIGGAAILDDCIIRVDVNYGRGNIVAVYTDDSIKFDKFISTDLGNVYNATKDKLYARCKNGDSGKRLADFMNGKRWSK